MNSTFYKNFVKPVLTLALITLIAGVALSTVYTVTKDPIEANELAKKRAAYKAVCEAAADFVDIDAANAAIASQGSAYADGTFGSTTIDEAYAAVDANGNVVGYVFSITNGNAYNPPLKLALGVAPDGTVLKISFTELNETPGKGSKADDAAFKDQFNGHAVDAFVLNGSGEEGIDAISGATVTSKAVLFAVNAGLDFFRNVIMEGGN